MKEAQCCGDRLCFSAPPLLSSPHLDLKERGRSSGLSVAACARCCSQHGSVIQTHPRGTGERPGTEYVLWVSYVQMCSMFERWREEKSNAQGRVTVLNTTTGHPQW